MMQTERLHLTWPEKLAIDKAVLHEQSIYGIAKNYTSKNSENMHLPDSQVWVWNMMDNEDR